MTTVGGDTTVAAPPLPAPDEATAAFWDGVQRGVLRILRCDRCRQFIHYPRPVCRFCGSTDLSWADVSGRGTIYTFTVTMQPFHPFWADKVPYVVACVELAEQPRLQFLSNIVDCDPDDVEVGMPVEVTFREITADLVLPVFRPVGAP